MPVLAKLFNLCISFFPDILQLKIAITVYNSTQTTSQGTDKSVGCIATVDIFFMQVALADISSIADKVCKRLISAQQYQKILSTFSYFYMKTTEVFTFSLFFHRSN